MSLLHTLPSRLVSLRTRLQAPAHDAFALALRLVFGWQFFLTGRGKLAHLERTTDFFASLHIPAPGAHAVGIGLLECVGGLLLLAGAGTRLLSALLASTVCSKGSRRFLLVLVLRIPEDPTYTRGTMPIKNALSLFWLQPSARRMPIGSMAYGAREAGPAGFTFSGFFFLGILRFRDLTCASCK